ncbi:hypothetical protein [Cellulomonas sp. ATA003]|uniref:hypothetical protein n=1 Tax=Cellulomonas sp. ATA003 TaxID=3073064 RepID=UPI002872BEFC|nr:hypothetical protein [Cellulomonas sp. ATA003]WNB87652.1 hypothetical protein REH70_16145 [Cellulomonas sp. ATA003]
MLIDADNLHPVAAEFIGYDTRIETFRDMGDFVEVVEARVIAVAVDAIHAGTPTSSSPWLPPSTTPPRRSASRWCSSGA